MAERVIKFFQRVNGENSIKAASILLIVTLALSNLFGMLRDHFLAQRVPARLLDVYYAAFRLPDTVFNLLILGAVASAFIPVFSGFLSRKENEKAWKLANNIFNLAFLALTAACFALYFLMPFLIPLIVPKFDYERLILTIKLSRLMLFTPVFFGLSYILGGILNAHKRFFTYSLAPLIYNLAIIFGAIVLAPRYGVMGVGYSVIAGAFFHLLVQMTPVFRLGFRWQTSADYRDPAVQKIGQLMIWRTIALSSQQLTLLIFTAIGSSLTAGSIAVFNLANNIQTLPTVVFGTSFATALFPTLTETAALGRRRDFLEHLSRTLRLIFFLMIPSTVGLLLLRAQVIRLILGSGYFGWGETIAAADALAWFSVSLLVQGPLNLLARSFYALHDTRTPAFWSIIFFLIALFFSAPLARVMGVAGLALTFSLASLVNFLGLYFALGHRHEIHFKHLQIISSLAKALFAGLIMAFVIWLTKYAVAPFVDMHRFWGVLVQFCAAGLAGLTSYLAISWILKIEELGWIRRNKG